MAGAQRGGFRNVSRPRAPAAHGLIQVVKVALNTLTAGYIPRVILASRAILFLLALGIGFLVGFRLRGGRGTLQSQGPETTQVASILLFVAVYLGFMVISSLATEVSPLTDRLLSPIYVPVTLLVLLLVDQFLEPFG